MTTAAWIRVPAEVTMMAAHGKHGTMASGWWEIASPHGETEVFSAIRLSKKLLV